MKAHIFILAIIAIIGVAISFFLGGIINGFKGALTGTLFGFLIFGYFPVFVLKQIKMSQRERLIRLGTALFGATIGFIFGIWALGLTGALVSAMIGFVAFDAITPFGLMRYSGQDR
jgi:hypothetical protein